ncbi:MAG: carboxylesterase/lipase family protein [Clostridiales bacterium]|jgi:para-nitrobenzyl esterase|nr:carboxylesterase/lipase family protein [Clostridiales bacterium]
MPLIRTAKTESGIVRGLPAADPRITSYKGVPFAAPPVRENRWRAPRACMPWEGEYAAYDFAPITPQAVTGKDKKNIYTREWSVDDDPSMDEDCLYLNIWAPAEGQTGLPVFVWYFGGGLQAGSTSEMEFDGERIARRGVVVVTINYRLNVFGFLAHPELTVQAPGSPTNFGFLDQQFATRWVKRNIAAFGGNPNNITIGGQSAGGMSVSAQIAHLGNEGLFCRGVIISGLFAPVYPEMLGLCVPLGEAEKRGELFFRDVLGVQNLEEARHVPWQTLLNASLSWKDAGLWPASVDGAFLHYAPDRWYMHEDHVRCPVMTGSTNNEFRLSPRAVNDDTLHAYAETIPHLDRERFLALFSSPATKESIRREGEVNAIGLAVRAAAMTAQEPIYAYEFSAEIPGWDHPGAFHSVDLWFFFETLAKCWRPFTGKHYDLARQMCDYLYHFVCSGNPNGTGTDGGRLPYWPNMNPREPVLMSFGDDVKPVQSPLSPIDRLLLEACLAGGED